MTTINKPKIETFQSAMSEFSNKGKVESTKCERCDTVIQITRKNESALEMKCECGLYNDNLRGI